MIFDELNPTALNFNRLRLIKVALVLLAVSICAFGTDIEVWAVPSIQKVRPDDPAQSRNAIWDGASRTISLAGAKNEHVPFQVVISTEPPNNRVDPPASGLFVTASDLVAPAGRILSSQIKLYFEDDILCQAASSAVGAGGFWPDALAPLTDPFSMAAAFRQTVKNRPIWIDIVTPSDAHTGIYTGTVQVTQNGHPVSELNVRLTLYDFALSPDTHLITYMGVGADQLARFHKVSPSAAQALLRKYHAFLYANRMEPWFNEALQLAFATVNQLRPRRALSYRCGCICRHPCVPPTLGLKLALSPRLPFTFGNCCFRRLTATSFPSFSGFRINQDLAQTQSE